MLFKISKKKKILFLNSLIILKTFFFSFQLIESVLLKFLKCVNKILLFYLEITNNISKYLFTLKYQLFFFFFIPNNFHI